MTQSSPKWEIYERMIARMIADQISTDLCVTPNARLMGRISGRSRQIDVLLEARHDTNNTWRIIVDAKKRSRKIDIKEVEAFQGLMEDVNATHDIMVSPTGYTKTAEQRAQTAVSIQLVPLDHLNDFDPSTWPKCANTRCTHGRVFWDGYPGLSLILRPVTNTDITYFKEITFVHYVGKCDRCGRFHIKCLKCNAFLSPSSS